MYRMNEINGVGCFFAYDVGFFIRILGLGISGLQAGFVHNL